MNAASEMYTFGNRLSYPAACLQLVGEDLISSSIVLDRPDISKEAYAQNLEAVNTTWRVIEDPKSERQFEIAVINDSGESEQEVDLELSTFTSSISGNPGNAVEFAQNAAVHSDRTRVYVANFGNGYSSYWNSKEAAYLRKTGRCIGKDGEVLPTMKSLADALQRAGYIATRVSTNSAGGAYGTALMHALPGNQVTHAYLKSRPNLSNHPTRLLWGASLIAKDEWQKRRYAHASQDPWKLTSHVVNAARDTLCDIYGKPHDHAKPDIFTLGKLWTDMLTFSRGPRGIRHPAAEDTAYALDRQPDMLTTYHMPLQDPHYNHLHADAERFLRTTGDLAHIAMLSKVLVFFTPGAHGDHTYQPHVRWAAENYALGRLA